MAVAQQRILSVDATRGFAMVFVCLSHFCWTLGQTHSQIAELLEDVSMIATPTFLLLSGAMLGLLQLRRAAALPKLAARLFHRGLFVLIFGHLVMSAASALAHSRPYLDVLLDRVYITDVIGICLMLLPRITAGRDVKPLVVTGIALYLAALLAGFMWQPASQVGVVFEQMLFGSYDHHAPVLEYVSPIVPYVGLYLAGIGLGRYIERASDGSGELRESRLIMHIALGMVLVAVCAKAAFIYSHLGIDTAFGTAIHELTAPFQKFPPGPTYLLAFVGLGLLALCAFIWLERRSPGSLPVRFFAVFGQASFFVFILQFYIFGPMSMRPEFFGGRWWPLSYLGAIALLWCLALLWRKWRGNRIFDITYMLFHPGTHKLPDPVSSGAS